MKKLYHKDIGIPVYVKYQLRKFLKKNKLQFSYHLRKQQGDEWRREYDINKITIDMIKAKDIFEVETDKYGTVTKVVVRTQYNDTYDVCMPIIHKGDSLFVKTIWLNHHDDTHKTLNKEKYEQII